MKIWFLFVCIGLTVQQEPSGGRLQYAYLRPTSLKFVPLQWVDADRAQHQQKKVQIAQKPYFLLRPAPVTAASTADDYGDNYRRPIEQSRPWSGATIYELLPASVPKRPVQTTNQKVKVSTGATALLIPTTLIQSASSDKKQPVREQKPWFTPLDVPVDEPKVQPLLVSVPTPLIATLISSDAQDKPVRGQKPWFGPPFLPADPNGPQVDPQRTLSTSSQDEPVRGQKPWFGPPYLPANPDAPQVDPQPTPSIGSQDQPVRGHKPWFGPPFLPAADVENEPAMRASAVPQLSPLIATLIQAEQPVRGQKPWFGPAVLSADEAFVDDVPQVEPTPVVLPSPLIATLIQPAEQPVRGQKPWFGPPILQEEAFVEESLVIQPSAVALPSPLMVTLTQEQEQPVEIETEKPVRGHKPWFGPPFLPADPVKQPKPIIVEGSAADDPLKQPKPLNVDEAPSAPVKQLKPIIVEEDSSAIEPSVVSVPRPLIATLLPGEFPHVGAAQKPVVENLQEKDKDFETSARFLLNSGQSLITTSPVGGGPVTVFRPTTVTVFTAPICLATAGGGAGPAPPPGEPFPAPCPARRKRSESEEEEEEFILVDGKKFSPSEVEKLLSTAKPNFEEFGEDRRAAAVSLASLTSSMDEAVDVTSPSPASSRTQRLLPGLLTVTSDLTIPVYAPNGAGPTSTVTILGACVPQCLATVPQCVL